MHCVQSLSHSLFLFGKLLSVLNVLKPFLLADPPPPTEVPSVKAVSHSSLSVEFSDFDPLNGPLEAYAVMITTEDQSKMFMILSRR